MVTKFWVYVAGDIEVGLRSVEHVIDLGVCIDDLEISRDELRKKLTDFFSDIFGEPVGIDFDDERQKWIEEEEKYMKQAWAEREGL